MCVHLMLVCAQVVGSSSSATAHVSNDEEEKIYGEKNQHEIAAAAVHIFISYCCSLTIYFVPISTI